MCKVVCDGCNKKYTYLIKTLFTMYVYTFIELTVFENYRFRIMCKKLVEKKWFDNVILLFIALNCITLAMERPNIPPNSTERIFLSTANYIFTVVFALEMFVKVVYLYEKLNLFVPCVMEKDFFLRRASIRVVTEPPEEDGTVRDR
jgi:hypothetical protein